MLINDDATLRKYIPNVLATCEGEISLFDKLKLYLTASERWLEENFVGTYLPTIMAEAEPSTLKDVCRRIVVADAFSNAIPSLDLVLTPSGFGIVSNSNLAPASAERVRSLIESLSSVRDSALHHLLLQLSQQSVWRLTRQSHYFASTLFPNFCLLFLLGKTSHQWDYYQQHWQSLCSIEAELAANYISQEVYARLRQHTQEGTLTVVEQALVNDLRQVELDLLQGKPLNYPLLIRLVNQIRQSADFPEWQTSSTAKLFSLPSFENKKENHGFWW